jgi:riboflavin synthase
MFTGIVQAIGVLKAVERGAVDARLSIDGGPLDLSDLRVGDSVAVNGVCLTAVERQPSGFAADVSAETLARTTLGRLAPGARLNLEKALLPTTRLGGHLVSGHVDGVGEVTGVEAVGDSRRVRFAVPPPLARYVAAKGSICVDGVSLTVNEVAGMEFTVNLIPHTLEATICSQYEGGSAVNLEVDLVARYLEALLRPAAEPASRIDRAFLARHGYVDEA